MSFIKRIIINVDQTPVCLDLQTTISFKGAKEININTFGYDKNGVSVVLAISCNGYKFPPLIIFKGGKGKLLEKRLNKHELCKNKKKL